MLRQLALGDRDRRAPRNRTGWRGSRSCPDRSPGYDPPAPRADHKMRRPRRKGFSASGRVLSAPAMDIAFEVEAAEAGDGFRHFASNRRTADLADLLGGNRHAAGFRGLLPRPGARFRDPPPARLRRARRASRSRRSAGGPLLTENVHPQILVGYGDPAVLKTDDGYWLVATSNDAPDAFPILHSNDLEPLGAARLRLSRGAGAGWAAKGRNVADFWAPEMARVGEEYWLVFTARQESNALAIGLARAPSPLGPWVDNGAPLITGKPINTTGLGFDPASRDERRRHRLPHLRRCGRRHAICSGRTTRNSIWPRPLAMLLREHPRADRASCSRATKTAGPPPSPRRSSPGPTSAGRWSASS